MKKLIGVIFCAILLAGCTGYEAPQDYPPGPYDVVPDDSSDWEGVVVLTTLVF